MEFIRRILAAEPAVFIGFVSASVALLAVFGFTVEDAKVDAILDAVPLALGLLATIFGTRQSVFSGKTHLADITAAYEAGLRDSLPD